MYLGDFSRDTWEGFLDAFDAEYNELAESSKDHELSGSCKYHKLNGSFKHHELNESSTCHKLKGSSKDYELNGSLNYHELYTSAKYESFKHHHANESSKMPLLSPSLLLYLAASVSHEKKTVHTTLDPKITDAMRHLKITNSMII